MRMSAPKRRFLERHALKGVLGPTVIGADTVVIGDLRGTGPYAVFGQIHGDGVLAGALHLGASASWHGTISAHHATIAGQINGTLIVADKLEIGHTAVIRGRVTAQSIAIATGAIIEGDIEVTSGLPIVRFDEQRSETD
jgi:cytoskeletal protein CcmA (bactofilin family)